MKKIKLMAGLILLLMVASNSTTAQTNVSGVAMPGNMKVGSSDLVLNGAGVRVKFMMDMYVAGLYLPAKANVPESIIQSNTSMAVKIHIVSSLVTSERMADAIKEGFKKATGGNTAPIQAKIDRFIKLFSQEAIVKGNEFDNEYVPGEGVKVYKNGKLLDTIDGLDFKAALWGIWLGNDPADKNLKSAMLGVSK